MHSLARSVALGLLLAASGADAAPWTYRGTLNDGGAPGNGRYDIRLSVLDAGGVKSLAYPLTFSNVEVRDGAFAVDVDFGVDLTQLGAVKLRTEVAQGGSGFVALGEPQAFDAQATLAGVCWDTQGNAGTDPATNFIGTTDLRSLVFRVGNLPALALTPFAGNQPALFVPGNSVSSLASAGVALGGGSPAAAQHTLSGDYASITGGYSNSATGDRSHIGGGDDNSASGYASVVAGGGNNGASGIYSTVGGGQSNFATGTSGIEAWTTVGGGYGNKASGDSSTVAGGNLNDSFGSYSAVPGGRLNCAGGDLSFAAGFRAVTRAGNQAGDEQCFQVAGSGDANGDEGTFVWADSQASNFVSTGPNQFLVRADGGVGINGTPATAGLEMNVFGTTPFDGFVEFGLIPKPSLNGNTGERIEFGVGKGGAGNNDADLRIVHRNDGAGFFEHLSVNGNGSVVVRSNPANTAQGVQLAIGAGAWSTLSDRKLKTDIQSILPLDVLERLVAMPIQQWRYIGQPGDVQHIGPMAQDFAAAFGVGENDTTISTVDADGVALAAIQGLNLKLETELAQSRAENAGLQAQLQQLAARLAALEAAGGR